MISSIEYDKNYCLYLTKLYGGSKYNVIVIGHTNIDNVTHNSEGYNIYETFFKPLGYGLTSYYAAVNSDTKIYICLPIESFNPYTIGTDKLYIPESLIDMAESDTYVKVSNIAIGIEPIVRYFGDEDAKRDYIKKLKEKTINRLKALIDYTTLDSEIYASVADEYILQEDLDIIDEKRNKAYDDYKARVAQEEEAKQAQGLAYLRSLDELNEQKLKLKKEIEKYKQLNIDLDAELQYYLDWHKSNL